MKSFLISVCLVLFTMMAYAQHSFVGIQTSPRRGMIHAAMNPAELNHLHKDYEINLISVGASITNNALTFQDVIREQNLLEVAFNQKEGPVNFRSELQILGPSFGFKADKWSFGFTTQIFTKADIIGLDSDLGRAIVTDSHERSRETIINYPNNQRINATGWMELGFLAGREILETDEHLLSAGISLKLIIPSAYFNTSLNNIRGTLTENMGEVYLSNASGELDISFQQNYTYNDFIDLTRNDFSVRNISGTALDIGLVHHWKDSGIIRLNSGISLRNLGSMAVNPSQIYNRFIMDIPEGVSYRLDLLEGNIDEIEEQLLESGYFVKISGQNEDKRINMPTILSAYTTLQLSKVFSLGMYGQVRMTDNNNNNQITSQNLFSINPRFVFGNFEIYSSLAKYEVSGLAGGLGLRMGGFFIGSQSVLTGIALNNRTMMADIHAGLSFGF